MAGLHVDVIIVLLFAVCTASTKTLENPKFSHPIENVTVAVGREAILACVVENLITYKVAWLRVDTQTILTIHNHVITKNHRIGVTHSELRTWFLHIREVRESDRGWYMCQINTDPMKSQVGYLDVVVPPDILDYPTSTDMVVQEGTNVSLRCVAKGFPEPSIVWKRERGNLTHSHVGTDVVANGTFFNMVGVRREQMGPYLCIASNGIPPSVSKRIMLIIHFPPKIWIEYQLVGAYDNQQITLECQSEAYPKSINYWTRDTGEIVPQNEAYEPEVVESGYKVHMKLTIRKLGSKHYGIYKCISKNSVGETEGTINIYRIPKSSYANKSYDRNRGPPKDEYNEVPYRIGSSQTDLLFLGDEYYSTAHQNAVASLPLLACLRVLTHCLPVMS